MTTQTTVRATLPAEVHKAAKVAAASKGLTLEAWLTLAVQTRISYEATEKELSK